MVRKYPKEFHEDLMHEAFLGLVRAGEKNSNEKDFIPSTYGLQWARFYIQNFYHKNKKSITIHHRIKHEDLETQAISEEPESPGELEPEFLMEWYELASKKDED